MQLKELTKLIRCPYCGRITSTEADAWHAIRRERYLNSSNCRKFCLCNECYDLVELISPGYTNQERDVIIVYRLEDRINKVEPRAKSYWRLSCNLNTLHKR